MPRWRWSRRAVHLRPPSRCRRQCPTLQLNPETDWMYTADAGKAGSGLTDGRMMVPRGQDARRLVGHQLHGLRARPSWRLRRVGRGWGLPGGATTTCSPYFKKSEGLAPSGDIVVDADAHNTDGSAGRVGARSGARRRAGVRRRRGRGRHSRAATTTAVTAAGPTVSCRSCRPPPGTASGRARITRSSKATSSSDRTSR